MKASLTMKYFPGDKYIALLTMHPSCCCLLLTVVDQSCAQHSHSLQILLLPLPFVSDFVSDQDLDSSSSSWLSWLVLDCHEPCPPVFDQYLQKLFVCFVEKYFIISPGDDQGMKWTSVSIFSVSMSSSSSSIVTIEVSTVLL